MIKSYIFGLAVCLTVFGALAIVFGFFLALMAGMSWWWFWGGIIAVFIGAPAVNALYVGKA